jgi:3-methylcrotonyl-CoA carboxylase alpha subunit
LEKYVSRPRHIEVQVFGDCHGNMVHLFERDCSTQRRHQKVIEEAPAPGMDAATRAKLTEAAVKAAKAVNYIGAGTIEFIADASEGLRADRIWFMEMNTRLQVEHPVTEAITGEDLVEWQLRVASGEKLPKSQDQLSIHGWAMEARLYAENPASGFLPSTGPLTHLKLPHGVRIDSGVEQGDVITPYYDPMIAKLIVHAPTRLAAAAKLASACAAVEVWPVKTNAGFLARAAADADFVKGGVDTGFIERHAAKVIPPVEPEAETIAAAAAALLPKDANDPWAALTGFRGLGPPDARVTVEIGGKVHLAQPRAAGVTREVAGESVLFHNGDAWAFGEPAPKPAGEAGSDSGSLLAPMPGAVILVDVARGQSVKRGQRLLVLEAMKMEYVLAAPFDGVVAELTAKTGARVNEGTLLARIEGTS